MPDLNLALYYPSMEFRRIEWLKGMLLFWDGIRRIVPKSYIPHDCDEIKPFLETGLIQSIDPGEDAAKICNEFKDKLENLYNNAAALDWIRRPQDIEKHYRIHPEKVDARLRDILSSKEISLATKDWLHVSEEFGRFYMFYLANAMAERRGLAKITDTKEAWTASSYFDYDGTIDADTRFDTNKHIITLMLRNFIPGNIKEIPSNSIISFREKYRDERKRFIDSVKTFIVKLSNIDDSKILEDAINEYKKDVEQSIKDFRESLASLRIVSLTGIKTISIPVGFNVAGYFGEWNWEYKLISSIAGLALGLLTSYADYREKRKKLIKQSDFSYIYFLNNSFDKWHYNGGSLNYHLFRQIEEFVND
jgi:hypothetical protein